MTSFAFNVSDGDVDHFHVNGEPVIVNGEEVEIGDFIGQTDSKEESETPGRLTQRRRRPPPAPTERSRSRQRQRQRKRPEPQSEEENESLRLKIPVGGVNEIFGDASPIKIGFDRKFLVPNFQPLKFRSTTTKAPTTTRPTTTATTRRPRIASTVTRATAATTDSTTAAILNFEPKRTNRRRSTTTPSPTSVETEAPYSTKAKAPTTTTPLPFLESQTVAPLRIVQSSSYVVENSNSLGGDSERNYYPAKKEGRSYYRKEELLEELIELLSESIQHRHKDKASSS